MKYGIYFLLLSALMLSITIQFGGWYWIMIYPALSFAIVSIGYMGIGINITIRLEASARNMGLS